MARGKLYDLYSPKGERIFKNAKADILASYLDVDRRKVVICARSEKPELKNHKIEVVGEISAKLVLSPSRDEKWRKEWDEARLEIRRKCKGEEVSL